MKRPLSNTGVTTKDEREARAQSPFGNSNQYSQGQRSTSRVAICTRPSASSLGQQGAVVRGEASGIPKPRWTGQDSVREGNGSHDRLWSQGRARTRAGLGWIGRGSLTSFLTSLSCFLQHLHALADHFFQAYVLNFEEKPDTNTPSQWTPKVNLHCSQRDMTTR